MNPVLPLLAILSLAGLLLRRREIGIPWAACGLAGIALLWPALRLPDGIPSPAATLAMQIPWQGAPDAADPTAGNPNLRDVTHQVQPWLLFLRREMRAGRLPFWDPHQFSGNPYWSNGSGAPLFPLHLLFALLPLRLGWVLLPWLRIVIGGCGAWYLARELGASRPAALAAALVYPLSGMITSFLLFPMGNTHALVPWVLLAVERLASRRGSWPGLAAAGGLQMLGGHPETPVFTALLAAVYLLARGSDRPLAAWLRFAAGWGVAAAISAIQILPFFLTLTGTGKWLHPELSQALPFATVGAVLLRLVLPDLFGNPALGTWWGPFNSAATAVYAGALTLPLAAAGLAAARSDRRWRAVAVMTLVALAGAYHLFGLRRVLLAMPLISRGLHHYMKFGVELGLALLAAAGCDRWLAGRGRGLLIGGGLMLGSLAVAWGWLGDGIRAHGLGAVEAAWTAWVILAVLFLVLSLRLPPRRRWSVWPLLPALLAVDLVAAHGRTNPGLSNARLYPVTGAVRFLQGRPERMAGMGDAFHPDAAMVHSLYDVRGDSPVKLQRYDEVYATMGASHPVYFEPVRSWSSPWLDRLGVRWVAAGPSEEPPPGLGWRLAYQGSDARVYERPGALPLARLERGGMARIEERLPGRWRTTFQASSHDRLIVAETWDPGWRAWVDGRPAAIERLQGILMAVPVGPGAGVVELRYHPDGFVPGMVLSALGLCALAVGALAGRGRREGTRLIDLRRLIPLLLAAAAALGCQRPFPRELALREAVEAQRYAAGGRPVSSGLWFHQRPDVVTHTFDGERRAVVLTSVDPWRWTGVVPRHGELHAGVQILPEAWQVIRGFRAWVVARSGSEREVLDVVGTAERRRPRWLDFTADLSRWGGREVTLEFHAALAGLPPANRHTNVVAWGPVRLSAAGAAPRRPNVLFILVDTLRFDHLTPYGYRRDTSPEIARALARPGAVVESAYSQAPWTLPSVVSFLTGRQPGEVLGDDFAAYGVPPGMPTLAEALRRRGYETGGFFGNRLLHAGNGFDRGFDTFFSPPPEMTADDNHPDAAELNERVLPWLEAHRRQPFFLYVHYIDPHDPYDNPEILDNRSPFESAPCPGCIPGRWMQGVYAGKIPLPDPARQTEHITALYDSEIHYADRFIGRLLDSLPPEVLRDTLIVLTADHGEELHEHGGWKHGFTLYEEQIHVPLIFRWDGHIPAGSRLPGTVRLLDLAPTLARAAGGTPDPSWEGIDLLPALRREAPLPRLAAFARHMMIGPLRSAAVLDGRKLILFNPRTPYTPKNELEAYLWTQDLHRLRRVELYDLSRDAGERSDLAPASPGEVARLQPLIHRQLDRELPGLRVFAAGFQAGVRIQGMLTLDRPPAGWDSYFLAEGDRVELAGNRVSFDLGGETLLKGFRLEGDFGGLRSVDLNAGQVLAGGKPYKGGPLSPAALTASLPDVRGPALLLWLPGGRRAPVAGTVNAETEKRLRALGYIQ